MSTAPVNEGKIRTGEDKIRTGEDKLRVGEDKLRTSLTPAPLAARGATAASGAFPLLPRARSTNVCECLFELEPNGFAAEQFRLMQRKLANVRPGGGCMLVTSPGPNDGKSLNARNLAWGFAEASRSTLLLELDLRRPTQCKGLAAHPENSVEDVLRGRRTAREAVRRIDNTQLHFLGLTQPAKDPVRLLRSAMLSELLEWSKHAFQWVVIDAPPVLSVSDVEELLPHADLVLMIVRERVTPLPFIKQAADRLGKRLNYLIFNDVKRSSAYGYGYGYLENP